MRTTGIPVRPGPNRADAAQRREARLRKAAVQFEAVFLQTLLRSMRQTVPESGWAGDSSEGKLYRQMLDEKLAGRIAGGGRFGIADLLVQRYLPLVEKEKGATDAAAPHRPPAPRAALAQAVRRYAAPAPARAGAADAGRDPLPPDLQRRAERLGPAVADTLRRFARPIADAAAETGLPPALILSVVTAESGGRPDAVSPRGALGLMQLLPETAAEVGIDDPLDPAQNIHGGARYLAGLHRRFGGDLALALAGYNAGPGNVERHGGQVPPFPETRRYVRKVLDTYHALTAATPPAPGDRDHEPNE